MNQSTLEKNKQLTVIILTFNEALHIKRAIEHLAPLAPEIFIVDSFSKDLTVEIAEELGVTVFQHEFVNQAQQFQWALENCPIQTTWVMRLDADEVLEPDLIDEIKRRLPQLPSEISGINLKRKHIFMERFIKHGTRYPLVLLRIWRHGNARIEQRWMDEHMILTKGKATIFNHNFSDHNLNNINWWIDKHNKYAIREAIDVLNKKYNFFEIDNGLVHDNLLSQASLKRNIKEHIYNIMPFFSGPILYFFYRYIIRLGFLDGKAGFVYHFLQGFWYRVLVEVKVHELEIELKNFQSNEDRLIALEKLTGHAIRHK